MDEKLKKELKERLSEEEFQIIVNKRTERPFTGEYNLHFEDGQYSCKACNSQLFESGSKFESHCGWPSFDQAIADERVREIVDRSFGMVRTEVVCSNCGGHLGHVFDDGPTATGQRYCINSASISFNNDND